MKKCLSILAAAPVIVSILLMPGCGKPQDSLVVAVDKHGDEIMQSTAKAEAREWMQAANTNHVFFKADAKQVAQYVDDFYKAGATQVLIADIEEEQGFQYGEALLVVLPKDPAARAKLFEVGSRADTDFQNDSVSDQGQKYLYYSLD
jgi:hypothetical protein